jgi:hypothetical protein
MVQVRVLRFWVDYANSSLCYIKSKKVLPFIVTMQYSIIEGILGLTGYYRQSTIIKIVMFYYEGVSYVKKRNKQSSYTYC